MSIEIRDISKRYGMTPVLERLSLQIETGQLVALLGPSGCGKTTLLRLIAGLEQPDTGAIHFHGEDATHLHVRHRRVGFVFQHYALFPHLSVFENIAFGLRVRPRRVRPPEAEIRQRVQELLELVQLGAMANRRPAQLSGGQRQRVRWRGRWPCSRACCCSMNPSAHWMPRCARTCAVGCGACTTNCTSPACSLPTTRKKPWKWRIG